jgi:hypothetical protein
VVRQLRILVSQFRVLRTGTLFEIRPDNMYQPLAASSRKIGSYLISPFFGFLLASKIAVIKLAKQSWAQ